MKSQCDDKSCFEKVSNLLQQLKTPEVKEKEQEDSKENELKNVPQETLEPENVKGGQEFFIDHTNGRVLNESKPVGMNIPVDPLRVGLGRAGRGDIHTNAITMKPNVEF